MTKHLYYNPKAATGDPRKGMGYGKSQKIPSFGTGQGSENSMGSPITGIYVEPTSYDYEDEDELELDDRNDIDRFVKKINKNVVSPDPAFWPRADRGSLGQTSIGWALGFGGTGIGEAMIPRPKGQRLPKATGTIAPFPSSVLYPNGFNGPPLGTGDAGQAFRTTGPYKRTGTVYGPARAPINYLEDEDIPVYSFDDILDLNPGERAILRQKIRIMKLLNRLDEVEDQSDV
ncbi:MAG: hypothetical protein CMB80_10790 [Flammeovirgaceae bacterium]|nr:hypothetical protein [Flammeovirgaceae bacterium]